MQDKARPAVRIRCAGTVSSRHDADELLSAPGDVVLVDRGRPRSLVFSCPDGCGAILTINLDERTGRAWRLYRDRGGLSVYPSVWRDAGCEAHFIVWHDRILWCGRHVDGSEEPDFDLVDEGAVREILDDEFRSPTELADRLGAIPWEVSRVCERLSRRDEITSITMKDRRRLFRRKA